MVTGGKSGIGRSIDRRFLKEDAKVALSGPDKAKGVDTLAEMKSLEAIAHLFGFAALIVVAPDLAANPA